MWERGKETEVGPPHIISLLYPSRYLQYVRMYQVGTIYIYLRQYCCSHNQQFYPTVTHREAKIRGRIVGAAGLICWRGGVRSYARSS